MLSRETRTQSSDQTQHLGKVTKQTLIFLFSPSPIDLQIYKEQPVKGMKTRVLKDGWIFFCRFLESRGKALTLKAVQSGESLESNSFHEIKNCENATCF